MPMIFFVLFWSFFFFFLFAYLSLKPIFLTRENFVAKSKVRICIKQTKNKLFYIWEKKGLRNSFYFGIYQIHVYFTETDFYPYLHRNYSQNINIGDYLWLRAFVGHCDLLLLDLLEGSTYFNQMRITESYFWTGV